MYMTNNPNPKSSNPFVNGCSNFKTSISIRTNVQWLNEKDLDDNERMTIVKGFCMKMLIGNLSKNMQEKNKLMLKYPFWKFFQFFSPVRPKLFQSYE